MMTLFAVVTLVAALGPISWLVHARIARPGSGSSPVALLPRCVRRRCLLVRGRSSAYICDPSWHSP